MTLFQQLEGVVVMSLKHSLIEPIPSETIRVAQATFPKGNLYLARRDEFGVLFVDIDFRQLFSRRGLIEKDKCQHRWTTINQRVVVCRFVSGLYYSSGSFITFPFLSLTIRCAR